MAALITVAKILSALQAETIAFSETNAQISIARQYAKALHKCIWRSKNGI
jgi:hypothetical protein